MCESQRQMFMESWWARSPVINNHVSDTFIGGVTGDSSSGQADSLQSKLSVNEEYMGAFRTKSYIEICGKVQGQLRTTGEEEDQISPLSPFRTYSHLSENLLEPRQEILVELIETSNLHHLIIDYFEVSLEAFRICGLLLQVIDQTRADHRVVQRVIKLTKRVSNFGECSDDQYRIVFNELASFAQLDNPLSGSNRLKFSAIRSRYGLILVELTMKHRKVTRRAKVVRICKKASGISLVIACGAVAIVTLVLALHSLVGVVAAPGLVTVPLAALKKSVKAAQKEIKSSALVRFGAQLDAAAKGVYILNRDFDTLSRLVTRLHIEIEHRRSVASLCVKYQKRQMLKEVVKEFQSHESCFMEQLEELEDHVYLCFLTINRARRLVIQETVMHRQEENS
ncbi:hypothetical protein IFM89_001886 [Coptis chinensis]|uniref:Uncharacterized protein n=1 Tax=Coptis chinensis TaxID=261450 RepID=A0A835IGF2_9MAGN|nr:hypothetical protein IFM89_001886 [Coptis chinensis]